MKIASYLVQPVRVTYDETVSGTHVVLRLRTDDGIEGVSLVSRIGGSTIKPLVLLIDNAAEQVRGQDPMNGEALHTRMYRSGVGGLPSGLEARAASAIDVAAWDIRGKALGQPVWRLMGGFRDRVPVSANWAVQSGPDIRLIVDANQQWTVKQAIAMGGALDEYEPFWIEDPVPANDYAGLRQVKDALATRICAGEVYQNVPAFKRLMDHGAADLAMIDLDLGLTGFLKVAHLAEAHGVPVVNHLASEILAHGIAAVPNGLIVGFYPWAQPLFRSPAHVEDGYLCLADTPGLGLELDEDALRHFALD